MCLTKVSSAQQGCIYVIQKQLKKTNNIAKHIYILSVLYIVICFSNVIKSSVSHDPSEIIPI